MAKPNQPGKRTETQRQLHYTEMVKLLVRGWTKTEIAAKFGVSFTVIHNDFKKVMSELAESRLKDAAQLRAFKMEEYSELKKEAWMAWERSKEDSERITIEESDGMDGEGRQRKTRTMEGRLPDSQYLRIIATCLEAERELDGLNAPTKVDQTIRVDWDVFARGAVTRPHMDTIEAQIKAVAIDNSGLTIGRPTPLGEHPTVPAEVSPTPSKEGVGPLPVSSHLMAGLEEEEEKTFADFSNSMLGETPIREQEENEDVFGFLDLMVETVSEQQGEESQEEDGGEVEEEPVKPDPQPKRPRATTKPTLEPPPKPVPKPKKPSPRRGPEKSSKEKRR